MKLVIGNKNYSSWSMRPWLLMTHLRLPFEEVKLRFTDPDFKARAREYAPTGLVPALVDGDLVVWDSLAIIEYLAEKFPERGVWPAERAARAWARSISAEMHGGFPDLRRRLAMNCELRMSMTARERAVERDIARILQIWSECRTRFGASGPYLFGAFSAADSYYAPVVRRFVTYGIDLPEIARAYVATMEALPAMKSWMAEALEEHDFLDWDEPYRDPPI